MAARDKARRTRRSLVVECLETRQLLATWSGDIFDTTDGVPRLTNSEVHRVTGNIRVPAGKTLTIEPGTIIQFNSGTSLTVDGILKAVGTDAAPIYFTSPQDNSPTGGGNTASPGNWGGITFNADSDASRLEHIVARYGGSGRSGLIVTSADIQISNSTISHTPFLVAGVRIQSASPNLTNLDLRNNYSAASMDLASSPMIVDSTATSNTVNGMLLDSGSLTADVTWNSADFVYVINNQVTVPAGRTLTVANGQVIKATNLFSSSFARLNVDGTLRVEGSEDHRVVFTAFRDDSAGGDTNNDGVGIPTAPGDWAGIRFSSTSTANVVDYADVRYGGTTIGGSMVVDNAPLTLTNSVISKTAFGGSGLRLLASHPILENVAFRDNLSAAIGADLRSRPSFRQITMSGNRINAMFLETGVLPGDTVWDSTEVVYAPDAGTLTVPQGVTLTVHPGVIVKPIANTQRTNMLRVEGTLDAQGTVEQPITFTSLIDHTAGGVTNTGSVLSAGQGYGFLFTATSSNNVLDHVDIRYGAELNFVVSGRLGTVNTDGPLTLTNSVVRNSAHVGVFVGSTGIANLSNNLIVNNVSGIQSQAGSQLTAVNNTIDGSAVFGVILDSPTAVLTNNLITNSGNAGVRQTGPTSLVMTFNDVYNPGRLNYSGLADLTGLHGNISRDPQYFDRASRQFFVRSGSPVQDAGTSSGAPPTDFLGFPRFDDPNISQRGDGSGVDMGAFEVQELATSNVDLAVFDVSGPTDGQQGMTATVQWTVKNQGSAAIATNWSDALYLSDKPYWTPLARLLKQVPRVGGLAANASYTTSTQVTLEGILPGRHYFVVRTNDLDDVFEGQAIANNAIASATPIQFALPTLTLNESFAAGFSAAREADYYQFDVSGGQTLRFELLSQATAGVSELYVSRGSLPTRSEFDFSATDLGPNQEIVVPDSQPGTYYVLAYANTGSVASNSYSITASEEAFGIQKVSPDVVGNAGQVTLTIDGTRLTDDTRAFLIAPDQTVIPALDTFLSHSAHLTATFDMTGRAVGAYSLRLEQGQQAASSIDAVTVTQGVPGNLKVEFLVPGQIRGGRQGTVTVRYTNDGQADLPAPLLAIKSTSPTLRFVGDVNARGDTVEFLAINPNGPAGVLPPGASGSIDLLFVADTQVDEDTIRFELLRQSTTADNSPLDWLAAKDALRPAGVGDSAWNAVFANFREEAGDTVGEYQALLDRTATALSRLGAYVIDEARLLAAVFQRVGDFGAIAQRYTLGAFGRGMPDPTSLTAVTDSDGNVRLITGGLARAFLLQPNNSYRGGSGELGVLTRENGVYRLRETDGTLVVFRPDGKLDYRQDRNGNRVTASYTDGKLTTFTDSKGDTVTFVYNSQGRISQVIDPVGRTLNYTYDVSGEYLLSVEQETGTQHFTYITQGAPQVLHAIESIEYPDGTQVFFTYDAQGRLIRSRANGNAYEINYAYDGLGSVTSTDSLGNFQTIQFNEWGAPGYVRDFAGQITRLRYDHQGNLLEVVRPDGSVAEISPDGRGNPATVTNALGFDIHTTFDSVFNTLQIVRDAGGAVHSYRMDARGNPVSLTYPDGTSQQFRYNSQGQAVTLIDPMGRETRNTFNASDLLLRQDYADGSWSEFTYDERRNLTTATNDAGTTTYDYELESDRLSQITYPAGQWLRLRYDAIGRRTESEDSSGLIVRYAYDSLGRLAELTRGDGERIVAYSYDSLGRLGRQDHGNGSFTLYSYDAVGRILSQVTRNASDSILASETYTYDAMGRRMSMTTLDGTTLCRYDAIGQLISVELPGGRTIEYQYDAAGNRISVSDAGQETLAETNPLHQYTAVGSTQLAYDAAGNLISRTVGSEVTTYEYTQLGQLAAVHTPTESTRFIYDATGTRIASEFNGVRTSYLIDPAGLGNVVGEYDANGQPIARYVHGLGLTSRLDASGDSAYYSLDATGNTTLLVSEQGTIANHYRYLPYGEKLSETETLPNPFTFGGGMGVMEAGEHLYFMRARHYAADLGRFLNRDPIGMVGGLNLYAYATNDPVNRVDPLGTDAVTLGLMSAIMDKMIQSGLIVDEFGRNIVGWRIALSRFTQSELIAFARAEGVSSAIIESYIASGATGGGAGLATGGGVTLAETIVSSTGGSTVALEGGGLGLGTGGTVAIETGGGAGLATRVGSAISGALPTLGTGIAGIGLAFIVADLAERTGFNDALADLPYFTPPPIQYGDSILAEAERLGLSGEGYVQLVRDGVVQRVSAIDPNDIAGPLGVGASHFVIPDQTFPYIIHFENLPTATAPALVVAVTQQLDDNLDWSTFELGDFGFGPYVVDVPAGRRFYSTRVDATSTVGEYVDVSAEFDATTGQITWTFTSIDPATGQIPEGATDGFLPPEDGTGVGQGFVTYLVQPRTGLATGDTVPAQARVIFDAGLPGESFLDTPVFVNTIDITAPRSNVELLPTTTATPNFTVRWSGEDDVGSANQVGIASYDVYVSVDGSAFSLWQSATTETSAIFAGAIDRLYQFYSVARDRLGHVEAQPATFDAQTTVRVFSWHNESAPRDVDGSGGHEPIDALLVINELNAPVYRDTLGNLPPSRPLEVVQFLDVTDDGMVTPIDALLVINTLNGVADAEGEAEERQFVADLLTQATLFDATKSLASISPAGAPMIDQRESPKHDAEIELSRRVARASLNTMLPLQGTARLPSPEHTRAALSHGNDSLYDLEENESWLDELARDVGMHEQGVQ
ncbi:MAG: RHS repeat-associated core domain-containing protein [Pirellulales bacterium]